MTRHSNPKCKSCKYRSKNQAVNGCDYICIIGKSRGCSVNECDKYEKGNKINCSKKWNDGAFLI